LSLGCGDDRYVVSEPQIMKGGLWHWKTIMEAAVRLQSLAATVTGGGRSPNWCPRRTQSLETKRTRLPHCSWNNRQSPLCRCRRSRQARR
jgi:hypothetical protein